MYMEAIKRGTENAHIYSKIGKTYMMMHAYKDAANFYAKAVKKAPADVALRLDKAALLVRTRQIEMAQAELGECEGWLKASLLIERVIQHIKLCTKCSAVTSSLQPS